MSDLLSDYDYILPEANIAQTAVEPREEARLLCYSRATGQVAHEQIKDLVDILRAGDVLVLNETKVFKARLRAVSESTSRHELVFLHEKAGVWTAVCKNMIKLQPGRKLLVAGELEGVVVAVDREKGTIDLNLGIAPEVLFALADRKGEVPLPPYIENKETDLETYQTTFAKSVGSVAAPTAGRHFTPALLDTLRAKGIEIEFITLHIGLGTFQPIRTDLLSEHAMHSEWAQITPEVAQKISAAKTAGRRIVAVGTTVIRTLEGVYSLHGELPAQGFTGELDIFITPGYQLKIVDSVITNFHLPRTTLFVLISALIGLAKAKELYKLAISEGYRFYSLGDAMFIE